MAAVAYRVFITINHRYEDGGSAQLDLLRSLVQELESKNDHSYY